MDTIEALLRILPKAEDVEDLKSFCTGNIQRFSDDNCVFKFDMKKHCEIIRRYDEVISTKAEKFALETGLND